MSRYGEAPDEYAAAYADHGFPYRFDSEMRSSAEACKQLVDTLNAQVQRGEDGHRDLPFEDMLKRQKDAAVTRVRDVLDRFKKFLPAVEKEVSRCESNLSHVAHGHSVLVTPGAKTKFEEAKITLEQRYLTAVEQRKQLVETIQILTKNLERARSNRAPAPPPVPSAKRFSP